MDFSNMKEASGLMVSELKAASDDYTKRIETAMALFAKAVSPQPEPDPEPEFNELTLKAKEVQKLSELLAQSSVLLDKLGQVLGKVA